MSIIACSIDGCENKFLARGWCSTHYRRWRKTGTTADPAPYTPPPCSVAGCVHVGTRVSGLCIAHYARMRTTGTVGTAPIKQHKAPVIDDMKRCGDCGTWLPLDRYNTNSHKTGPKSMCRECERVRNADYREANPTYWQSWQKDNAQLVRDIANRRRATKFSREHEKIDRDLVFERDNFECKLCMSPLDMSAKFPHPLSPTLDHIVALNKGGHHLYVNLQAAHFRCNTAKGDRVA